MILTRSDVQALNARLDNTKLFVLDVETHKTATFDGKQLLGVAVGIPNGLDLDTYYVPTDLWPEVHPHLNGQMVGFNLSFDLEICEQNGFKYEGFIWDVLVMAHLVDENEFDYSLDHLAGRYLKAPKGMPYGNDVVSIKDLEKIYGWETMPAEFMGWYAEQDIKLTWQLFHRYHVKLNEQELMPVYRAAAEYVKAIKNIMHTGLLIDWDLLEELSTESVTRMSELERELGFSPNSPTQLARVLYEERKYPVLKTTPKGKPATDVEALNRLMDRRPEARELLSKILEWRNLSKAQSTWYDGFRCRRTASDRLHPGLKQHGTKTGRLSCAEPNLQQIPRDGKRVKRLFSDPPGMVLVEFDYAGVELRCGSYYAMKLGDAKMYEMFRENADVHHATAEAIGAYEQLANKKEARQVGKTGNFAWIYGVGAETFSTQLYKLYRFDCTIEQAEEWGRIFHHTYPGYRQCLEYYSALHRKRGYVEMFNKRRARIRSVGRSGVKHHIAFNRVVQGGCGQLLMYAIIKLNRAIEAGTLPAVMCNTVHDSVWFYIEPEHLNEATATIIDLMRELPEKRFGIPFEVEPKLLNHEGAEWHPQQGAWQKLSLSPPQLVSPSTLTIFSETPTKLLAATG